MLNCVNLEWLVSKLRYVSLVVNSEESAWFSIFVIIMYKYFANIRSIHNARYALAVLCKGIAATAATYSISQGVGSHLSQSPSMSVCLCCFINFIFIIIDCSILANYVITLPMHILGKYNDWEIFNLTNHHPIT